MVMAGTYSTTDLDDLTQGLTPYMVNLRAQGKAMIIETNVADHDRMLSGGEMVPSLSECQQLKITMVDHPAHLLQINARLAEMSIANDCILGPGHRLSVYLHENIHQGIWIYTKGNLETYALENHPNQEVPCCPKIFRSVQLKLCDFYNRLALPYMMPVPLPDLASIIQHCIECNLPPRTLPLAPPLPAYLTPPPAYQTPVKAGGRVPYVALPAAKGDRTRGTVINNTAVNATYKQKFEQCGESIRRTLRDDARAPQKLHGGRICLSWHLKGTCYGNCGTCNDQMLDGHRPLVGDEVRRLETFVAVAMTRA
jgi:hypothetical protein